MSDQDTLIMRLASNVRLFSSMTRPVLSLLLSTAEKVTIDKGATFFEEGETGESFYVLVIGQAVADKSIDRRPVRLATFKTGDAFGEMTLIGEHVRSATVRATSDCVALHFTATRLRAHPGLIAEIYLNIAKILSERLKLTSKELAKMKAENPDVAEKAAAAGNEKTVVDPEATVAAVSLAPPAGGATDEASETPAMPEKPTMPGTPAV